MQLDPEGVEIRALTKLAPMDGLRVLELGCGDGRVTLQIAEAAAYVYAVDPDEKRIRLARESVPTFRTRRRRCVRPFVKGSTHSRRRQSTTSSNTSMTPTI